ncbi:marvel domain-containing protein [Chaetomidium leptoderma]|uniref:Marvel domain-containing protein n=1 Tax=Chaetomidium leptoderma TaxID=669021 RepID=A0AAN6VVX5_9PEZI|nr:marvel domain-containing protein [Chaetomidium leptoderma]
MHRAVPLGLRALQFLIALTVLALAAAMIANQVFDSPAVTIRYSTFTGGFGMIVCGVGIASLFVSFIPALVPIALDGLAGLLFLGGGIAWAIGLRGVDNCTNGGSMLENGLLNQGSVRSGDNVGYGVVRDGDNEAAVYGKLRGNCQRAQADEILQFICFAMAVALAGVGYLQLRRGGSRSGAYVA